MKFSIIVPVYNIIQFLPKCVESILAQTWENFELILVDDGSADGSEKLCDKYAGKDKRITVIHKENGGLVSARQAGIQAASGEYIVNVDGDDWIQPRMLETALGLIGQYGADMTALQQNGCFQTGQRFLRNRFQKDFILENE